MGKRISSMPTEPAHFRISVELIPESSFYNNLRKIVHRGTWDKLRRQTYEEYNHTCGKCGTSGMTLECHEIWEFDELNRVQKLSGLIAVCKMCHLIIHHGYANILIHQKKLDKKLLVQHFIKVNGCSKKQYESHVASSFQLWEERSKVKWTVDLGEYKQYVTKINREFGL